MRDSGGGASVLVAQTRSKEEWKNTLDCLLGVDLDRQQEGYLDN